MSKNLIVDLDGVVCQYDFSTLIKKHFGVVVTNEQVQLSSLEDCLALPSKRVKEMFTVEAFQPPNMIPKAQEALELFTIREYNIIIYSNRLKVMTMDELKAWLDQYNIPFNHVVNGGGLPSHAVAAIDDSPTKLLHIDEAVTCPKLLLFSNPWNQLCLDVLKKFKRVTGWPAIVEEIDGR